MSAENLDSNLHYGDLHDLEDDFQDVELELLRQQAKLTKHLFAKREQLVADIPNFWPLVFEQSPPDIDEYLQPSDAALLLGCLKKLSVERFELPEGDPRSISIKFDFSENDHFENSSLEKRFWWRCAKDGWSGLVSEPVDIKWKTGKDLTDGMVGLSCKVWDEERAGTTGETAAKTELKKKMKATGLGGMSFFAFFGFRGRYVSADEDREARKLAQERRKARDEGKADDESDDDDDDDEDEYEYEIFPMADDLALSIAEDLWPGAIKYFIQAQEMEEMSEMDFESDDGENDMGEAESGDEKKEK